MPTEERLQEIEAWHEALGAIADELYGEDCVYWHRLTEVADQLCAAKKGGYSLLAEVRRLRAECESVSGACEWTHDEWHDYYETACGSAWCLTDGTLEENSVVYCHKCGRRVVVKEADDVEADPGKGE